MKKLSKYLFFTLTTLLFVACSAEKGIHKEDISQDGSMTGKALNGQAIATASCSKCHNSSVYTRADRKVKSLSVLTARVKKCNANTGAGLNEKELEALTSFLNTSYYKFK